MKSFFIVAVLFFVTFLAGISNSFAQGAGYDAGVYGVQQGQVMSQGYAQIGTIVSVRNIRIETPMQNQRSNQYIGYAVTGAGGALGGILGNSIDKPGSSGRAAATVIGGILGVLAGQMANESMNSSTAAPEVTGVELTVLNQQNQMIVINQGGQESFSNGEKVLLIQSGNSVRVTRAPNNI